MARSAFLLIAAILVLSIGALTQSIEDAAPVPLQISAAKKVFISNAGTDSMSLAAFRKAGHPDKHYNEFYAAMKKWGRYELVAAPSDADLVFELRFTAPLTGCNTIDSYDPQLRLNILDAKTHFVLWSLTEPVQGAYRKATWVNNFEKGITALMDDLKKLVIHHPDGQHA